MIQMSSTMKKITFLFMTGLLFLCITSSASAQYGNWGYSQAVGGVAVDQGLVKNAPLELKETLKQEVLATLEQIPQDLDQVADQRKVSLKKLDATLKECIAANQPIPDAVRFLGGLTSVQYVIADPETKDIILVGPGEGWTIDNYGAVVGKDSGKPILLLEDLITVFRTWNTSTPDLISCSIDPTPEGRQRLNANRAELRAIKDTQIHADKIRELLGDQVVTLTGVPADSRYANVMVAADYKMKRLGLDLDSAPISRFPSYLDMVKSNSANVSPRFWLAGEFSKVCHDESKLVWSLGDLKVKTFAARDLIDASGQRAGSAKVDGAAVRWAEMMTKRYDELAAVEPAFAELRNCIDLSGVVGLIFLEHLHFKADCQLSTIFDADNLPLPKYNIPTAVESSSSIVQVRGGQTTIGCGGVEVNPIGSLKAAKLDSSLADFAKNLQFVGENWWSN